MPISVLYDHQIFCWQQYGGISRYFVEIANQISGLEQTRAEVFAPLYVNAYFDEDSSVRPKGIQLPHVARTGRILDWIDGVVGGFCVKRRNDVDIFHETYYSATDNIPSSAKRVITVHDMIHEKFPEHFLARDHTAQLKALAVARADHVICISESTRKDLIELQGVADDKITVVHHGGSLPVKERPDRPELVGLPYLLYVGMRGGYKNFSGLLRAYAASKRLQQDFAVVCFGGGAFSSEEKALMKELAITDGSIVQLSGSDQLLAGLYAHAAVFVFPSRYEGFGIPALEAMSCGCPVVCASSSSLPEVAGEAAEYFDPGDIDTVRSAIERVVYAKSRSDELIGFGYRQAQKFSWGRCAENTLDVYKRVLASS